MIAAREAKEAAEIAAHQSTIDQDASNLAAATGGSVVPMQQEDIFELHVPNYRTDRPHHAAVGLEATSYADSSAKLVRAVFKSTAT